MKAPAFDYACPTALAEAIDLLARGGEEAQILAGGQSLMPALNFRLSAPALLVDINRIAALKGIELRGPELRIGALVRHAEIEASDLIRTEAPLLAQAIAHVAHPAIRNRGTIGGSLALADPGAELPACAVALDAKLVLAGAAGTRTIAAGDFFRGLFQTDRQPGEILTEILIPRQRAGQRSIFLELSRRHGDFAIAGVACQADLAGDVVQALRLVVFGAEPYPHLARHAIAAVAGQRLSDDLAARAAAAADDDLAPIADLQGSVALKRHLSRLMVRRALARLAA
jgi:aerobic carbon-monoxide dehydrogenase medium subunit